MVEVSEKFSLQPSVWKLTFFGEGIFISSVSECEVTKKAAKREIKAPPVTVRKFAFRRTAPTVLPEETEMDFFRALYEYGFLQHAMAAAVLSGIVCGIIGTYIVARRMVFLSG